MSQHKGLYVDITAILDYMRLNDYPGLQRFTVKSEGWGGRNKSRKGWVLTDKAVVATRMVLLKDGGLARETDVRGIFIRREKDNPLISGEHTLTYIQLVAKMRNKLKPTGLVIDLR